MTEQPKQLSRRDAIKVLGAAAGASVLATLPTKWTKPEITTGVLPVHAQTSNCVTLTIESLTSSGFLGIIQGPLPSSQTSNLLHPSAGPYASNGTSVPQYYTAVWSCMPGCLQLYVVTGDWRVTITGPNPFQNVYVNGFGFLIDLGTGLFSTNSNNAPGSCSWFT